MRGVNYDNWLNRYNPYDDEDIDEELEEHINNLREMVHEDDQRDYCDDHHLDFYEIEHHLKH